jgi:FMN phosphatase YigB (HAD superfamily)
MDVWSRVVCPSLALHEVFQTLDNSSDCGVLKGSARFLRLSELMGLPISELCMLDDGDRNCEAFAALGGCTIRVDRRSPASAVPALLCLLG